MVEASRSVLPCGGDRSVSESELGRGSDAVGLVLAVGPIGKGESSNPRIGSDRIGSDREAAVDRSLTSQRPVSDRSVTSQQGGSEGSGSEAIPLAVQGIGSEGSEGSAAAERSGTESQAAAAEVTEGSNEGSLLRQHTQNSELSEGSGPGRLFDAARHAQGFRSQAHLDAFFRSYDHGKACPVCSTVAGYVELSDGPQPYLGQCDEGRRLFAASVSELFLRVPFHPSAEEVAAFVEGRASVGQRAAVVRHLADCSPCRRTFADSLLVAAELGRQQCGCEDSACETCNPSGEALNAPARRAAIGWAEV